MRTIFAEYNPQRNSIDDISFLDGKKEDADMLFSFTYHTHHIFLNNRETTDFS